MNYKAKCPNCGIVKTEPGNKATPCKHKRKCEQRRVQMLMRQSRPTPLQQLAKQLGIKL